jgi:arylsulfatase A-like enzyme
VQPLNLLFLYTDQQRYDTLGVYGNRPIEMPHLHRFAVRAAVFDQAYCTQH